MSNFNRHSFNPSRLLNITSELSLDLYEEKKIYQQEVSNLSDQKDAEYIISKTFIDEWKKWTEYEEDDLNFVCESGKR